MVTTLQKVWHIFKKNYSQFKIKFMAKCQRKIKQKMFDDTFYSIKEKKAITLIIN